MRTRSTGMLSSFHIVAALEGLLRTTEEVKLDAEERRRLEAASKACEPLRDEAAKRALSSEPEAIVGALDAVVDRNWGVLYGVLSSLAKLSASHPLGGEAAGVCRKVFQTKLDFIHKETTLQAQVGRAKLDELEATELSPALAGVIHPLLELQREDHTAYERAIAAKADTVKAKGVLPPMRKAASEALDAFIGYLEIMAITPKAAARAAAILAPVDTILAANRRASPKVKGTPVVGPEHDNHQAHPNE